MLKKHHIFFLFPFFLVTMNACTSLSLLEKMAPLQGAYQVQEDSDPSCQSGQLRIVDDGDDQGVRIGHHIYLGPFKGVTEPAAKDSCRVISTFSMLEKVLTTRTIVDECPSENENGEEGEITQILNFENKKITYSNVEAGYNCIYLKQEISNN